MFNKVVHQLCYITKIQKNKKRWATRAASDRRARQAELELPPRRWRSSRAAGQACEAEPHEKENEMNISEAH